MVRGREPYLIFVIVCRAPGGRREEKARVVRLGRTVRRQRVRERGPEHQQRRPGARAAVRQPDESVPGQTRRRRRRHKRHHEPVRVVPVRRCPGRELAAHTHTHTRAPDRVVDPPRTTIDDRVVDHARTLTDTS